MEKLYQNDIAFGNTIEIENGTNFVKELKFIPMKGFCVLIKDFKMNESLVLSWKYNSIEQQNPVAILTDPYKESNFKVSFDSFYGTPITGDNRNIYAYEVSIEVDDLYVDGETNTCLENSYSDCIHREVQSIMKRVCN